MKNIIYKFLLSVSVSLILTNTCLPQEQPKILFLSPEPPENIFWGQVIKFLEAVAEDLDVNLEVVAAPVSSSYVLRRKAMQIISRKNKPDYILTGYWVGTTDSLFEAAKKTDTKFFLFNTGITPSERQLVGYPRGQYPNWIGHMQPNDSEAGHMLADILANRAREKQFSGKLGIAALAGSELNPVSIERLRGLQQYIDHNTDLELKQTLNTTWSRESAIKATEKILIDNPDVSIIWAVADALVLGGVEAIKQMNKQPGKDIILGGFNWSDEGLAAVKSGTSTATIGGHFMEAGWALIQVYDYHNGIDFTKDPGISSVTQMHAITAENLQAYTSRLGDKNWNKIDFKKFTKTHNPDLKKYDFSLEAILESLNE